MATILSAMAQEEGITFQSASQLGDRALLIAVRGEVDGLGRVAFVVIQLGGGGLAGLPVTPLGVAVPVVP